ncbi:MAG TPA: cytochrome C oxidase subunit IV family protein [Verrucomicrobiae bacterium]|nr:cytochrome C oxidase subunit IV family protein [Verrucomicrobiae bacterium]
MNIQAPSKKMLLVIWLVLVALHFVILGCAWFGFGPATTPVIISLAIIQTILIMLYFMEVRYAGKVIRVFAVAGFFWLLLQLTLIATDYLSRNWH